MSGRETASQGRKSEREAGIRRCTEIRRQIWVLPDSQKVGGI